MKVDLRTPIPGDIGWLISMHGKLYAEQFKFDANFERDIAKKLISFLDAQVPFDTLWVATIKDEAVGSVAVSLKPDHTAFINFLLINPEYRGYGISKVLLDKVISHCKEHNLTTLRLETYSCLEIARKVYTKYGFTLFNKNVGIKKYGQSFDQEFWEKNL